MKKQLLKNWEISLLLALCITLCAGTWAGARSEALSAGLIRLHVVAASDEAAEQERRTRQAAEEKERRLQRVTLAIQDKFGKNAMLKGMNLLEGGTTIERNGQIGGHRAGGE